MKLLLDTHVFLWYISGDERLPKSFEEAISNPDNTVYLSVASNWEIMIKYGLGKLPLPESPETYIPKYRELHRIESLPVTESSLHHLISLPDLHRDPFDRLIISQALSEDLTVVTVDREILRYNTSVLN